MGPAARGAGVPVLVDPKGKDFARYAGATLLTPNRAEAEEFLGYGLKTEEALQRGLDDAGGGRGRVELKSAVDLPGVAIDGETLHHLLMADLFAALENLPGGERVRVVAQPSPDGVAFVLEVPGEATPDRPALKLTGRALTHALAAAILGKRGGGVAVSEYAAGLRVCFSVPTAG